MACILGADLIVFGLTYSAQNELRNLSKEYMHAEEYANLSKEVAGTVPRKIGTHQPKNKRKGQHSMWEQHAILNCFAQQT